MMGSHAYWLLDRLCLFQSRLSSEVQLLSVGDRAFSESRLGGLSSDSSGMYWDMPDQGFSGGGFMLTAGLVRNETKSVAVEERDSSRSGKREASRSSRAGSPANAEGKLVATDKSTQQCIQRY